MKMWHAPDGITFNEIDHICISRRWQIYLCDAQVYRAVDTGSDHHLVPPNLKMKLTHQRQVVVKCSYAIEKLKDRDTTDGFALDLRNRFEILADVPTLKTVGRR